MEEPESPQNTPFMFNFRLNYDDTIEEKLYNVETSGLSITHHCLQRKSLTSTFCLECGKKLTTPLEKQDIEQHFLVHNISQEQIDAFDAYHQCFLKLDVDLQMQQIFYMPFNNDAMLCLVCDKPIHYKYCKAHCSGSAHLKKVLRHKNEYFMVNCDDTLSKNMENLCLTENFEANTTPTKVKKQHKKKVATTVFTNSNLTNNENEENVKDLKENVTKVMKSGKVKNNLVLDIESKEIVDHENIDKDFVKYNQLSFHQCNEYISCLICRAVVNNFDEHCKTDEHLKLVQTALKGKTSAFHRINNYHVTWSSAKFKSVVEYQKYFVAWNATSFKCLLCKDIIMIGNLLQHIKNFPCSFVDQDNLIYDSNINWKGLRAKYVATKSPSTAYQSEIINKYYTPASLFDDLSQSDEMNVYTFQLREQSFPDPLETSIFCLPCACRVYDVTNTDLTDVHNLNLCKTAVEEHQKGRRHVTNIHSKSRMNQLYKYHTFFRKLTVDKGLLQGHVNLHNKDEFKCNDCGRKFLMKYVLKHFHECDFIDFMTDPLSGVDDQNQGQSHVLKQKKNDEQNSGASASTSKSTSNTNKTKDVVKNDRKVKDNDLPLCYDDETLFSIYPTCNTPRGQRRPEILTVQKRSDYEKYCLACACSLYVRGVEHISSEKHLKVLGKKRNTLRCYHNFWMSKSPTEQLQQIYFNPYDEKCMTCTGCHKQLLFRQFHQHTACIKRVQGRNSTSMVSDEFVNFELNYDKEIVRRFFYGPQYDLSRDILGTQVPVAYVNKRHFHCLLCLNSRVGKMLRNVDQWKGHLWRFHCTPGPQRDDGLRRVMAFHQYWSGQTLERQFYLCHFTLKSDGGIGCDQGHFMPLQQAVEHVEANCALADIILSEKNSRENMLRDLDQNHDDGGENRNEGDNDDKGDKEPSEHKTELIYPENNPATIILPVHLKDNLRFFKTVVDTPNECVCSVCKLVMGVNPANLRHHIASDRHRQKAGKQSRISYRCDICNVDYLKDHAKEGKWLNHMDSSEHLHMFKTMLPERRNEMTEYYCRRCRMVIFGDKLSLIRHNASGQRRAKSKPNILTPPMKDLLKSKSDIEEKGRELVAKCQKFREDSREKVEKCIGDLETLIKRSYPNCKIYQFGSRAAGFVVKDSDLDLFVDVDNKYNGTDLDYHEERKVVLEVRTLLKSEPRTYVDLHTVLSARVPIAKVVHAPTELDCDLSFINGLSVENTRLIKFYVDLQPHFESAMLLLKEWGSLMACNLKNDMTSYALCMMLIFNMQLNGYLPSVHYLRQITTFDVPNINGWDTINYTKLDKEKLVKSLKKPESVADIIQSFFKYYGTTFMYAKEVACPLLGRTFSVKLFDLKGKDTPVEMHTYRNKVEVDPDAQFKVGSYMFVQDPFDLGHNLTKAANRVFVNNFRTLCKLSFEHIKN